MGQQVYGPQAGAPQQSDQSSNMWGGGRNAQQPAPAQNTNSPAANSGLYFGNQASGTTQYPTQHNQWSFLTDNILPQGTMGQQGSAMNPNFGMNNAYLPTNNFAGSYLTQGPNTPVPGMDQTVGGQPFGGFSFNNPFQLGPFQNLWGNAQSPFGMSPSWSSGGKVW